MKKYNLLTIMLLAVVITSCFDDKKNKENLFSIDDSQFKLLYHTDDSVNLTIINKNKETIDSVVYFNNEKRILSSKLNTAVHFLLANEKLGYQNLKAIVYYGGETSETSTRIELVSSIEPKLLNYTIVNTYVHDIKAYTQGLEFYRDTLYEGTGNGAGNGTGIRGISSLRKTDYKTGKVFKTVELGENYFGEGITILNNKVYQLTYKNNEGYVYNADTFVKEKTLPYYKNMEGWGLTSDGKNLYMTDSTEKIHILDSNTFKTVDYINVYSGDTKIPAVNELEWVNGLIYGNIYGKEAIAIINPKSGAIEAVINLGELKTKVTQHPDVDVLNGIAYNTKTKTFFVTGKNWDKMFEIKIN